MPALTRPISAETVSIIVNIHCTPRASKRRAALHSQKNSIEELEFEAD
jgi:hypothetical protein